MCGFPDGRPYAFVDDEHLRHGPSHHVTRQSNASNLRIERFALISTEARTRRHELLLNCHFALEVSGRRWMLISRLLNMLKESMTSICSALDVILDTHSFMLLIRLLYK